MKLFEPKRRGRYLVYPTGKVCVWKTGKVVKQYSKKFSYCWIHLCLSGANKTYLVHRVIAETFLGRCPTGHQVNHMDGNKHNNALSNLEYVTSTQNVEHAKLLGLAPPHPGKKLTTKQITQIKTILKKRETYLSNREIARRFGVDRATITLIHQEKLWNKKTKSGYVTVV